MIRGGDHVQTDTLHPIDDYDPDANHEVRLLVARWIECFAGKREWDACEAAGWVIGSPEHDAWMAVARSGHDLEYWVQTLSLRDRRLTELVAQNPDETIGDVGAWLTSEARHALMAEWRGGDEAAMNAWLDAFVVAVDVEP